MDCREFRKKHVGFVDDVLPAVEMDAMQRHLAVCARCSQHNTAIRRSLLLFRNLPPIEPSPDFMVRLNRRIDEMGPVSRFALSTPSQRLPSIGAFAALAAGVAAVAYLAVGTSRYFGTFAPHAAAAPTVASAPVPPRVSTGSALPPGPSMNAAFVASVPTGMPVWPAMLMVAQAPMRFASMDFHEASGR